MSATTNTVCESACLETGAQVLAVTVKQDYDESHRQPELPMDIFLGEKPAQMGPNHVSGGDSDPDHTSYEGRWIALGVMLAASFMNLIDVTIVNVALPSLQVGLGASDTEIEWVVAAYIMAFSIGLLPFGRLGDMLGRRTMFLAGVSCFTLASALCGLAPNIQTLVFSRVFQGLAGAMMMPQTLAIAQTIFPPKERGSAFSLFGLAAGLASVSGPLIGGVLIGLDIYGLSWRPIFLVNIPIGIIAIVAGYKVIPRGLENPSVGIDFIGILLAGLTVLFLIFPLVEGRDFGWPSWLFVMMATSVLTGYLFVRWQSYRARLEMPQLMPATVLHNRRFITGALMTTLLFSSVPGLFMVLAVFLQVGFGLSPLQSGLTTLPFAVAFLTASLIANRLGSNAPRIRVVFGSSLMLIGVIVLRYVLAGVGEVVVASHLIVPLALTGLGLGTTIPALFQTVLANMEGRDAGSASGSLQAFQQAGAALGVAVMGQIFFSQLSGQTGGSSHAAFIEALRTALLYSMAAFSFVIIGGLRMQIVKHH